MTQDPQSPLTPAAANNRRQAPWKSIGHVINSQPIFYWPQKHVYANFRSLNFVPKFYKYWYLCAHTQALKESIRVSKAWVHAYVCGREAQSIYLYISVESPRCFRCSHLNHSNKTCHKISLYIISSKLPTNYFN